jgi:hypothetical protein
MLVKLEEESVEGASYGKREIVLELVEESVESGSYGKRERH